MAANDLCSLYAAKQWLKIGGPLGIEAADSDAVMVRTIRTCSASILANLGRSSLLKQTYLDQNDGRTARAMFMRQWPVLSITSVSVDGVAFAASTDGLRSGYYYDVWDGYAPGQPQAVQLIGGSFTRGKNNVLISYVAGYAMTETGAVPASPYKIATGQAQGPWAQDAGVIFTDTGAAGVLVTGTPAAGQYALPTTITAPQDVGQYQFAAADQGRPVAISYSYVPSSLEEACINWVAERVRYRERIGMRSQATGGQTTASYDITALPKYVAELINPFKRNLPLL